MKETEHKDDAALVEAFKNGSHEAFEQIILKHSPKLYQVAYGLLGNRQDAEEVVQDAFVRAHRHIASFRGDASFATWIYRIVVNLSRNKYHWNRRRGSEKTFSISSPSPGEDPKEKHADRAIPEEGNRPDDLLDEVELEKSVLGAIESLPPKLREIMILRHVEELSYEEIGNLLDCKPGTVKSRLSRGREVLRKMLKL